MADELPNVSLSLPAMKDFRDGVAAGEIHFEPEAARQAAAIYDETIKGLEPIRDKLKTLIDAKGFGGFRTGIELQQGFSKKASDGVHQVEALIDGALQLKETYLRAGGLIEDADDVNRARLARHTEAGMPGSEK